MILPTAGCNPTFTSPFTGKPVDEYALGIEAAAAKAQADAKIRAEQAKAAAELQQQTAAKALQSLEARAAADRAAKNARAALDQLHAETQIKAIAIQREADAAGEDATAQLARLAVDHDTAVARINAQLEAATKDAAAAVATINQQHDAALAAIEAKREQIMGVTKFVADLPVVNQTLGAAGVSSTAATGLVAALLGFGARSLGSRKRHDETYDQAYKDGYEAAKREHQAEERGWNDARTETVARLSPLVAEPRLAARVAKSRTRKGKAA